MNDLQKRTWAEISLPNLKHNYSAIRKALPEGCRFLGVVKADAYGHGALPVSLLLQEAGADYLAVSCLDEALELKIYIAKVIFGFLSSLKFTNLSLYSNSLSSKEKSFSFPSKDSFKPFNNFSNFSLK